MLDNILCLSYNIRKTREGPVEMNPFQSNNIWKRMAREKRKAEHPDAPEELRRKQHTSTLLWFLGGAVLLVLFLAGIQAGVLALNVENGAILAIIGLYTLYNAAALGRERREKK